MKFLDRTTKRLPSQASLAIVVAISIIFLSVAIEVSIISYTHYQNQFDAESANSAFIILDSATEEALYRLQQDATYSGGTYDDPFSSDNAIITVNVDSATQRTITVDADYDSIIRTITLTASVTGQDNPLTDLAIFSGENVKLVKSHAALVGTLWTNDNVDLDSNTIVYGNVLAAGQGNLSSSRVQNGAQILDNPGTAEVEGNISAIDRIRVTNSGYVENEARSKTGVTINSGGSVGSSVVDSGLSISTISIPVFDYATYKAQAQSAGTYYASPAAFLSYIQLNGYVMDSGVHYINSTSALTLPAGHNYVFTGTLISEGDILIYGDSYVHNADSNLPVLVSKKNISFLDQNNCACTATVNGLIYADKDVQLKHDQYTGPGLYAVQITGAIWSGDEVSIEDHSILTFDATVAQNAEGFNFDGGGGGGGVPPSVDNIVSVVDWDIQ
ncbi:hypothetical protein KC640_00220 [Candidatus Dojkabacteria bacterium]|uniref:Uncharacterized protein n=1 Tax=Candidatus Dojkabacteria bacterium TaxID=2099670 RepID=A0A955L039_9BACT|nr:hypothetical protein [Candidatus Dojkabacteria bacterium]